MPRRDSIRVGWIGGNDYFCLSQGENKIGTSPFSKLSHIDDLVCPSRWQAREGSFRVSLLLSKQQGRLRGQINDCPRPLGRPAPRREGNPSLQDLRPELFPAHAAGMSERWLWPLREHARKPIYFLPCVSQRLTPTLAHSQCLINSCFIN